MTNARKGEGLRATAKRSGATAIQARGQRLKSGNERIRSREVKRATPTSVKVGASIRTCAKSERNEPRRLSATVETAVCIEASLSSHRGKLAVHLYRKKISNPVKTTY